MDATNPITEVFKFTSIHPKFHNYFVKVYEQIFTTFPGVLSLSVRHYLGLMAASRHKCVILMNYHITQFYKNDGEPEWMLGLDHADKRYQDADELNRLLAHQPWRLNATILHRMVTRGSPDSVNSFTLNEIIMVVSIFIVSHNLCSIICALGLSNSNSLVDPAWICKEDEESVKNKENQELGPVERIIKCMRELRVRSSRASSSFNTISEKNSDEAPETMDCDEEFPFTFDSKFTYINFLDRPDRSIQMLKVHEFSWGDHSYNLISEFNSELASRLDKMFAQIHELTYNFMGKWVDVDSLMYREAFWNYSQALFGIKHDDYDYAKFKLIAQRDKTFIKNTLCYPQRLGDEFLEFMDGFKMSEKIHGVIISICARMQSQYLHFTRALCNYNVQCMSKKGYRRPLD